MKVELFKRFQFEAAHSTARGGDAAPKLHGHSYLVEVRLEGECREDLGWLVDYGEISDCFQPLFHQLDHHNLNEIEGLQDVTVAGVRRWIKERLTPAVAALKDVAVSVIGPCSYHPMVLPEEAEWDAPQRVRFGFEAAHALPNLPKTHKCSRMHGHSFRVEVGARDLIRLEDSLSRVYRELDHSCLNEIPGLHNATSEQISRWIWTRLAPDFPDLEAVIVAETCTARCVYRGL